MQIRYLYENYGMKASVTSRALTRRACGEIEDTSESCGTVDTLMASVEIL